MGDDDSQTLVNTPVKVRIIDIRWLLRSGKSFIDFAAIMENFTSDSLFTTEFLKALTNEFWTTLKAPILSRAFIPWVLYSALSLGYFAKVLDPNFSYSTEENPKTWKIYAGVVLLLTSYQVIIEIISSIRDFVGHWTSPYNWIDITQYILTIWIIA